MTEEEYKTGEYIEFYYDKNKRKSKRSAIGDVKPRYISSFSNYAGNFKSNKKKIKMMLLLNLGLLIIAGVIFFSNYFFTKPIYSDVYTKDGLEVSMTTLKSDDFTYNLYLNLSNTTKDENLNLEILGEGSIIQLLHNDELVYKQEILLPSEIKLFPRSSSDEVNTSKNVKSFKFPIKLYDKNILFNQISLTLFIDGEKIVLIEDILHYTN